MELLLAIGGLIGVALLVQSKALPSEADFNKAKEKLQFSPDDPDANTTVGKYYAFVMGSYDFGLPHLLKSSDKTLKMLAQHELDATYTDTNLKKIGMGDEWVAAARNNAALRKIYYSRAAQWYSQAWPFVDGLWKTKLQEQLRKLFQNPGIADVRGQTPPAGWKFIDANIKGGATPKAAYTGRQSFQTVGNKNIANQAVVLEQTFNVVPEKKYEFSSWVLSDGTDSLKDQLSILAVDQTGAIKDIKILTVPMDQPWWQKLSMEYTVPAGVNTMIVHLNMGSKTGLVYVDDLVFKTEGKDFVKNGSFE